MKLNKWQTRILRLIGSAALIVGIFWFIPFSDVIEALRRMKLGYVAAGLILYFVVASLESFQLWLLLRRLEIPVGLWRVFETKMITRFYGQFLPSELLASAVKLHRLAGPTQQWGEVVAALAFLRLVSMLVLLLLGLMFWAIEMPSGPGRWVGVIMVGMIVALVTIHFTLSSQIANRYARRVLSMRGFAWLRGTFVDKVKNLSETMVVSYRMFGNMGWSISFLAVIRHASGILSFGLLALSLGVHLSYLTIGWIRVVLQAMMMLPISVSGIGVREGSLIILLQEYAVPASEAVALALLLFAISLIGNSLGGLLELRNFLRPDRDAVGAARSGTE